MAYRSIGVTVRPNTDVDFFARSSDHRAYVTETYEDTGKTSFTISLSEDGLTKTKVKLFDNKDSYDEMIADETIIALKALRDAYNRENSISNEQTHGEV
jgi:hypothetical protein